MLHDPPTRYLHSLSRTDQTRDRKSVQINSARVSRLITRSPPPRRPPPLSLFLSTALSNDGSVRLSLTVSHSRAPPDRSAPTMHRCDLLAGRRGGRERDEDREAYFIVWPLSQFLAALSLFLDFVVVEGWKSDPFRNERIISKEYFGL